MLTEIYIEALIVDEKAADQVWGAWYAGEIDDLTAWLAWRWTDILYNTEYKIKVLRSGRDETVIDFDGRIAN